MLKTGSTITQWKDLAKAFSHKPPCLIIDDNKTIKHNGKVKGFLYIINEELRKDDIIKHPKSSMDDGLEWITQRDLNITLIEQEIDIEEPYLSDEEILNYKRNMER